MFCPLGFRTMTPRMINTMLIIRKLVGALQKHTIPTTAMRVVPTLDYTA